MKPSLLIVPAACAVILSGSCDSPAPKAPSRSAAEEALKAGDMPVLALRSGDSWLYRADVFIPAGVSSPGAAEVNTRHERARTYLGKVAAAEGIPVTDTFEIKVAGTVRERELVEIHPDRILMRGNLSMRPEATKPLWFDPPVPFVVAGMKPGTALPELRAAEGAFTRRIEVIAREQVTVPAGVFPCVRLLMTGTDGQVELHKTIWFAFGEGIIREEETRYRGDKLLYRETLELLKSVRSR